MEAQQDSALTPAVDRDDPKVARELRWRRFGIIGIIATTLFAVGTMAMQEADAGKSALEASNTETFRVHGSQSGKPYIAPPPEETAVTAADLFSEQPEYDPVSAQHMAMLEQRAMQEAEQQKKKQLKRLYSNQLVIDTPARGRGGDTAAVPGLSSVPIGGGTLLAGTSDDNMAFAHERQTAGFDTVGAVQLHNLHGLIPQGTMISGILETAITSRLPGMVRAVVSEDVYSFDKTNLLIPSGSSLVGQYRSTVKQGQSRVFVIWDRLIRPDGVSINLASFGTDSLGRSGLEGIVDTHFMERFGSSIMLSLIDAAIRVGVESVNDDNTATVAIDSGDDFSRASEIALENSINIPPTITVDQGERIKIFVGRDLDFSTVKQTAWRD